MNLNIDIKKSSKPFVAFDNIGGWVSDILFKSLGNGGVLYSYGVLSLKPMEINF